MLESVDILESVGSQIKTVNIFGEEKRIRAKIKALSLLDYKIVLEST